jgi:hypothetical protein
MSFSSTSLDRLALMTLIGLLAVITFTALVPGKTVAFQVADPEFVSGNLTDNAVTFLSQSALVLPRESVDWVRAARGYQLSGITEARARTEKHQ